MEVTKTHKTPLCTSPISAICRPISAEDVFSKNPWRLVPGAVLNSSKLFDFGGPRRWGKEPPPLTGQGHDPAEHHPDHPCGWISWQITSAPHIFSGEDGSSSNMMWFMFVICEYHEEWSIWIDHDLRSILIFHDVRYISKTSWSISIYHDLRPILISHDYSWSTIYSKISWSISIYSGHGLHEAMHITIRMQKWTQWISWCTWGNRVYNVWVHA